MLTVAPLTGVPAPFVTVPVISEVSSCPNAGIAIKAATMNKLRSDFIISL